MDTAEVGFGIFLAVGVLVAFVPQLIKIKRRRSHRGLSYWMLFLAAVNTFTTVLNSVMLNLPAFKACETEGFGECYPSLLSTFQLTGAALLNGLIYVFYLIFFEYTGTTENIAELKAARFWWYTVLVFTVFTFSAGALLVVYEGPCSDAATQYAMIMGIVAAVFNCAQLMPQIYLTYKLKFCGSVSVTMLLLIAPGSLMFVYFQAIVAQQNWTTWISVLTACILQFTLLFLALYYKYQNRGTNKFWFLDGQGDDAPADTEKQPLVDPTTPSFVIRQQGTGRGRGVVIN
eukprot:TRINITY_DN8835_c0_g1_i2.p1 TRINITY_DN8835_c0_g1~~TRINITY_DN8835_c0_g1_i2.p1  ORF type:complete len:288 (+),score=62.54 TRINITY_DN8835_c0_g1_i2:104-967(+)